MPFRAGFSIQTANPEILLAMGVAALGLVRARWLGWWERPLARLARRRGLSIAVAAAAPLVVRLALLPMYPAPEPHHHDEFSFLLAADTFLHGRAANPVHPFWVHFESMHILTRPSYASVFPVAPAMALAVGKAVLGS